MSQHEPSSPPSELLVASVGAAIFASDEPVHPQELAQAFGGLDARAIEGAIATLHEALESGPSGLRLEQIAGGYRLATRPDVAPWVRNFFRQRNRTRLSPAALETLAIVAYRQPVTAPEIQAIRGKDPTAALKNLVDKRLVRLLGKKKVVGSPLLYGTSKQFLVHFGLNRLEDLPSIEDFDEFVDALGAGQGSLFRAAGDEEPFEIEPLDEEPRAGGEEVNDDESSDDSRVDGSDA